jgi:hypothetical protein
LYTTGYRVRPKKNIRIKYGESDRRMEKLKHEELRDFYSLPIIIGAIKLRRIRRAGYESHMGWVTNAYEILVGRHEGNYSLGRPRCRRKRMKKYSVKV